MHIRQLLKELRSVSQLRMKTPWLRHFNIGVFIGVRCLIPPVDSQCSEQCGHTVNGPQTWSSPPWRRHPLPGQPACSVYTIDEIRSWEVPQILISKTKESNCLHHSLKYSFRVLHTPGLKSIQELYLFLGDLSAFGVPGKGANFVVCCEQETRREKHQDQKVLGTWRSLQGWQGWLFSVVWNRRSEIEIWDKAYNPLIWILLLLLS